MELLRVTTSKAFASEHAKELDLKFKIAQALYVIIRVEKSFGPCLEPGSDLCSTCCKLFNSFTYNWNTILVIIVAVRMERGYPRLEWITDQTPKLV